MDQPVRWSLSPANDINPVPEVNRVHESKTAITEDQDEPTIAGAIAAAPRFGLKATTAANKIQGEVFTVVFSWRKTGRPLRLNAFTLGTYASAFDPIWHCREQPDAHRHNSHQCSRFGKGNSKLGEFGPPPNAETRLGSTATSPGHSPEETFGAVSIQVVRREFR